METEETHLTRVWKTSEKGSLWGQCGSNRNSVRSIGKTIYQLDRVFIPLERAEMHGGIWYNQPEKGLNPPEADAAGKKEGLRRVRA